MPPTRLGEVPLRGQAGARLSAGAATGRAARAVPLAGAAGALVALVAGLLLTAGLAPFGWWPLALVGAGLLLLALEGADLRSRLVRAAAGGTGLLVPGLFWMSEFSAPGYVLATLVMVGLFLVTAAVPPTGLGRWLAFPGALVLADALRGVWPFGGVPIATVAQSQVGGPLAPVVRLGGTLLLCGMVGVAGVALAAAVRRARVPALGAAAVVVAVVVAGHVAPHGTTVGTIDVDLVQGGGPRGTRAIDSDSSVVFDRHVAAHEGGVDPPVDLVLWPEDVVDVEGDVLDTSRGAELSRLADEAGGTLVVGVVSGDGSRFRNEVVAWDGEGRPVTRFEKVQRVPFGEFIPFRSVVERVADVSAVPRDAVAGSGPGLLHTEAGELGVMISYEVFFARRADAAVDAGAQLLLVPTNASSFSTTQMPALQVAAARLRALETGRTVLQAGPTGFSAVIGPDGEVRERSDLGARTVVRTRAELRHGRTAYSAIGDWPVVALATMAIAAGWLLHRRTLTSRAGG